MDRQLYTLKSIILTYILACPLNECRLFNSKVRGFKFFLSSNKL